MAPKIGISEQRMLILMDWAISSGKFSTITEYLDEIGMQRQNMSKIRSGEQPFSQRHIQKACRATGANANWIFGFEEQMFRSKKEVSPIQKIEEALIELKMIKKLK